MADIAAANKRSDELIEKLDRELTIFLDSVHINGLDYMAHVLRKVVHPEYSKKLNEIESLKKYTLSEFFADQKLLALMPANSVEELENLLADKRNWSKKASLVGLQDEYNFFYEYTSSLIHCIGYSLFTTPEVQYSEDFMIKGLANKYSSRAIAYLHDYINDPPMKFIFIEDEKDNEKNT